MTGSRIVVATTALALTGCGSPSSTAGNERARLSNADAQTMALSEARIFARSHARDPGAATVDRLHMTPAGTVCGFVDPRDGRGWRAFYYLPSEKIGHVLRAVETPNDPAGGDGHFITEEGCPLR